MQDMRRILRVTFAILLVAGLYGVWFIINASPERDTSWPAYLALAFIAGLIGLGGELVAGLIAQSDETSDPLPKRVFRLLLLLASAACFLALIYAVLSMM
jgi:hypothetical protein